MIPEESPWRACYVAPSGIFACSLKQIIHRITDGNHPAGAGNFRFAHRWCIESNDVIAGISKTIVSTKPK